MCFWSHVFTFCKSLLRKVTDRISKKVENLLKFGKFRNRLKSEMQASPCRMKSFSVLDQLLRVTNNFQKLKNRFVRNAKNDKSHGKWCDALY